MEKLTKHFFIIIDQKLKKKKLMRNIFCNIGLDVF